MSDYRSFWFEMALKALPQAFFVAKSPCGGEAVVLAPNEDAAREAAVRIWSKATGNHEAPSYFNVERVPVVLCPGDGSPSPEFNGRGYWDVSGESDLFGDIAEVREAIMTARVAEAELSDQVDVRGISLKGHEDDMFHVTFADRRGGGATVEIEWSPIFYAVMQPCGPSHHAARIDLTFDIRKSGAVDWTRALEVWFDAKTESTFRRSYSLGQRPANELWEVRVLQTVTRAMGAPVATTVEGSGDA